MKQIDWEFAQRLALIINSGVTLQKGKQTKVAAEKLARLVSSNGKQTRPD